ncbi:Uncharacterised protein [Serratia quinivorans]|nr:Uncharacterised protein [Serratia quinivorans]
MIVVIQKEGVLGVASIALSSVLTEPLINQMNNKCLSI